MMGVISVARENQYGYSRFPGGSNSLEKQAVNRAQSWAHATRPQKRRSHLMRIYLVFTHSTYFIAKIRQKIISENLGMA